MSRGRFYTPADIRIVPGVRVTRHKGPCDSFEGSMDALVAAGLATSDMFPGQTGMPKTSVAYRPTSAAAKEGSSWHCVPEYMSILRKVDGEFRIDRTVSYEEQDRRAAALQQAAEEHERDLERFHAERVARAPAPTYESGSAEEARKHILVSLHCLRLILREGPLVFSEAWLLPPALRAKIDAPLDEVERLLQHAPILRDGKPTLQLVQ